MSKHSKKEFSELCGIPTKALSVYISRGKVLVDNQEIDDTHPTNIKFLEKQQNKNGKPKKKEKSISVEKDEPNEVELERLAYVKEQREKLKIDMESKQNDVELQRIKIKKQLGEMIPTDSVRQIFVMHSESMKSAYMQSSDNIIVIMGQRKEFNAEDVAYVRKKFYDLVNKAISDTITATKVSIDNLVKEFSEKRGVGQHD